MNRRTKLTLQGLVLSLAAFIVLGVAGDGGCLGMSAEEQCAKTGGTWGPTANWPTPCGEDPAEVKGKAVKAGESACMCPADKPNWKDGVGCQKCTTRHESCDATGGTWGTAASWPTACGDDPALHQGRARNGSEGVCTCPADKPNWTDGTGCQKCRIIRCRGSATWCSSLDSSKSQCQAQDGCYFQYGEWRTRTICAKAATATTAAKSSCCKVCTTGKACGDSCISASYTCTKPAGCACNASDSSSSDNDYDDDYDNPYDPGSGSSSSDNDYDSYDPGSSSSSSDNDYDDYDPYEGHTVQCTTSQYYTGDSCKGSAHSCDSFESEASCVSQRGCYWRP